MIADLRVERRPFRISQGSIRTVGLGIAVLFLSVAPATAQSQPNVSPKKELVWSLPNNEIASPEFSQDGSLIVLVTRVHWPDGDEAEGLPESVFEKLEQRKQSSAWS